MQVIVFPDAESLAIAYLNPLLTSHGDTARVRTKNPSPLVSEWVRVIRTGGNASFFQDIARLTFDVYATTEVRASALANLLRGYMLAADQITLSATTYQTYRPRELGAPSNNPDPALADKYARYSWTVQLGIRGNPL